MAMTMTMATLAVRLQTPKVQTVNAITSRSRSRCKLSTAYLWASQSRLAKTISMRMPLPICCHQVYIRVPLRAYPHRAANLLTFAVTRGLAQGLVTVLALVAVPALRAGLALRAAPGLAPRQRSVHLPLASET